MNTRLATTRRSRWSAVAVACGALVLSACSGGESEGGSDKVLELSALPGDHIIQGPVYFAEEQGFYEELGLDYSIEYPGSTVRAVQSLVGGKVGAAWTDGFGVLSAESQGFDLRSVYVTYAGSGFAMAVSSDSSIKAWDEDSLRDTTIGVTAFDGGEVPIVRAAMARLGLKEKDDYTLKAIGDGGPDTADAVEEGKVDVVSGSVIDLMALENRGVDIRRITPDYLASAFPGHVYAVTPKQLKNDREKIVGFLQAHAKALVWVKENPTCVAKLAMERAPETVGDLDVKGVADLLTGFWIGQNAEYFDEASPTFHKIGAQNLQGWSDYQDFLIDAGVPGEDGAVLEDKIDTAKVVTNELIDDVNNFDYDAVAADARAKKC